MHRYLGRRGWIVCLPEGQKDGISALISMKVEAGGKDWTQIWKVYGLVSDRGAGDDSITDPSTSTKRKAEGVAEKEDDLKRTKVQPGVSEMSKIDPLKKEQLLPDSLDTSEDLEACRKPEIALRWAPRTSFRLDVFLADNFREQVCRCKEVSPKAY